MKPVPVFWVLGVLLSIAVIVRALLGGAYHRSTSAGSRVVGRILLVFGVAMLVIFLVRIVQWYYPR